VEEKKEKQDLHKKIPAHRGPPCTTVSSILARIPNDQTYGQTNRKPDIETHCWFSSLRVSNIVPPTYGLGHVLKLDGDIEDVGDEVVDHKEGEEYY